MAPEITGARPVVVIGGGLSGIACARQVHDAGIPVRVYERSHRLGGRMAVRTEQLPGGPHAVDIGAPYFTVGDPGFAAVADGWEQRGLAAPWTDTFILATPDGRIGATSSPWRWSAANGMRSLVEDLATGLDIRLQHSVSSVAAVSGGPDDGLVVDGGPADGLVVDGEPAAAVVLAMPDPQAERLLDPSLASALGVAGHAWVPALAVWSAWPERWWPEFDAAFVDGSKVLSWVSDDGRSRGDEAPVLVAHTRGDYAGSHLDDVSSAVDAVLAELPRVLGSGSAPAPLWARVHRWSLASSRHPHPAPYALVPVGSSVIGVCGDGWGERSRVEQAWRSGHALGRQIVTALYPGT